jgi:hypothetical protein
MRLSLNAAAPAAAIRDKRGMVGRAALGAQVAHPRLLGSGRGAVEFLETQRPAPLPVVGTQNHLRTPRWASGRHGLIPIREVADSLGSAMPLITHGFLSAYESASARVGIILV